MTCVKAFYVPACTIPLVTCPAHGKSEFVRAQTGHRGPLTEATTLQSDIGVYGDDMGELLAAYAERFGVDIAGYLWYFHTGEEGCCCSIGGAFFPPPNSACRH